MIKRKEEIIPAAPRVCSSSVIVKRERGSEVKEGEGSGGGEGKQRGVKQRGGKAKK